MGDATGHQAPAHDPTAPDPTASPATGSHYVHGHAEAVLRSHRSRTAENSAAYLLPALKPGMSLLDVGCGPGTITVDLARWVAPGIVTAIDPAPDAVAATTLAIGQAGLTTATATIGDIYTLDAGDDRFDVGDRGFDVVHAHQVLQHVPDPVAALRRMRALRSAAGVVAARDADYAAFTWFPQVPALDDWLALYRQLARTSGGEPDAGRRLLSWARAAGFTEVTASASVWCYATPDSRAWWGGMWADRIVDSAIAGQALASGAASAGDLSRIRAGWLEWAASEDGWFVVPHGEILCRG